MGCLWAEKGLSGGLFDSVQTRGPSPLYKRIRALPQRGGALDQLLAGAAWLQTLVAEHVVTVALLITLLVGVVSLVR